MNDFILKVLQITSNNDNCDDIWWRTDDEYAPVTFFINCSDQFFWGSADCVTLTPENINELKKAYEDAEKVYKYGDCYGSSLFCCRINKMRPQGAYYSHIPKELWSLFDECGPERETGFGNPYKPGEYDPNRLKKRSNWIMRLWRKINDH